MSKEQNIAIQIERYLQGELVGEELTQFELALKANPELAKEVELETVIKNAVVDANLMDWKSVMDEESKLQKKKRKYIKEVLLGLTAVAIVSGVFFALRGIKITSATEVIPTIEQKGINKEQKSLNVIKEDTKVENRTVVSKSNRVEEPLVVLKDSIQIDTIQEVIVESVDTLKVEEEIESEPKVKTNESVSEKVSCDGVVITGLITTEATCEGESKGQIKVTTVAGGTAPYQFELNNSGNWYKEGLLNNLYPGSYVLKCKDGNGCVSILENDVFIDEKYCYKPEKGFNPDFEKWEYKGNWIEPVSFTIYNKVGKIILEEEVNDIFVWDGRDTQGQKVSLGLYRYIITNGEEKTTGTVSVIY